jgi:hypothetical protein
MVLLKFARKAVILEKDDSFEGVVYKCMVLLKFAKKDVILEKDDIFDYSLRFVDTIANDTLRLVFVNLLDFLRK